MNRFTPPAVVFSTTVLTDPSTGPGRFAQYLWEAFRDDPMLEFHIVAPSASERHPRQHTLESREERGHLYQRVERRTLEVCRLLGNDAVVHGNAAHAFHKILQYRAPWMVQVNDYAVATVWRRFPRMALFGNTRRAASLVWRRVREQRIVRAAPVVVCNSRFTEAAVRQAYGVPPERLVTIYKAADVASFRRPESLPLDPLPGRPSGGRLIFVGSDWLTKGLEVLIRALGRLVPQIPDLTLLVVGECPDPGSRRVFTAIRQEGVQDHVSFAGRLDKADLARHLWHADVLVLPSRREALGVAIIEAMAAGLPIVASDVGGIPEVVGDSHAELLCPPGDDEALADRIRRVICDTELRRQMAAAAVRRAGEFEVEVMAETYRRLYLRLSSRMAG